MTFNAVTCFFQPTYDQEDSMILTENVIDIVKSIYISKGMIVNVIYTESLHDFTNLIVKQINKLENISVTIEQPSKLQSQSSRRKLNIFVIDSLKSFTSIYDKMTATTFNHHGYYTIVWMDKKSRETPEVFELMWRKQIYNVVILSEENSKVKAQNFNPFSHHNCSIAMPQRVKQTSEYFDQKLKSLSLCPLKIHAPDWAPFIYLDKDKVSGRDYDFIEIVAKTLNFTLNLTIMKEPAAWGMIHENGSASGVIKNLLESKTDIIIGDFYLRRLRTKFMDASAEYFNADVVFVVPPGRSLKSIEKLLQPFSKHFWICLCILISCEFLFLSALNFWTKGVYNEKLVALFFKTISIFLAVSTSKPRRLFHRILFATLTISCFIFVAAYQGSLFKFLQKDSKLKGMESISEMIENNFKFYSYDSMLEILQGDSLINKR